MTRPSTREWPLNRLDAVLVAQTAEQRPMTTHYTLEIDRAIPAEGWARALTQLVETYPELGSRISAGARARRLVSAPDRVALSRRLVDDSDGSQAAIERWLGESIELERGLPLRVRIAPGQVAAQSVTLSIHHSVTDGVGALALFDRLTATAAGVPLPARSSTPLAKYEQAPRPELRRLVERFAELRQPAARMVDVVDAGLRGQRLVLREIGPRVWAGLGQLARAAGVSRTTVLWHAVATIAAAARLDDPSLPVRILAGVDLRSYQGVPADALGNWLGTVEHDSSAVFGYSDLHGALMRARRPERALLTPELLSAMVRPLPRALGHALFRQLDADGWPNPFTLTFAHIRPPARRCWPARLRPRRLWCTNTVPRKPGVGLTFTTLGDRVTFAATCQASVLRRSTVEGLLDAVLSRLHAQVAGTDEQPRERESASGS